MIDPALGLGPYLLGVGWIALVGAALVVAAEAVRRRFLGSWPTLAGGVGGAIAALTILTLVGQLLGSVGQLRAVRVLVAVVMAAGVVVRATGSSSLPAATSPPSPSPSPRLERWLAAGGIAAVTAQWIDHTAEALTHGMTHPDTVWYHGPYTARFLQMHGLGDLGDLGYGQARYYPLGSELLHSITSLPFDRDLLSPLVNLGFGALALVAAGAIGARFHVGALAALGTAMALGLPTLAGTQPGQGSNDIVAIALVLSAIAILVHAERRPEAMALGGLALGLAAGTKMTVMALAGPIGLGVLVVLWRLGHRGAARWWCAGLVAPAVYWPLRNLVLTGTPVPFLDFRLGPWHHTAETSTSGTPSLVSSLLEGPHAAYAQGLSNGFGPLWPLVLLTLAGTALVLLRGPRELCVPAGGALVAMLAYPWTPFTGGLSFQFNLRYLTPALVVAIVLLVTTLAAAPRARTGTAAALAAIVAIDLTASHHERMPAWEGHPAALGAAVVLAVTIVWSRRSPLPRRALCTAGVMALTVVTLGWSVQERYLEQRYVAAGLPDDALNRTFAGVSGARVALLGTPESYPMFGADLSNHVRDYSEQLGFELPALPDPCRYWREALQDADLIALSSNGFLLRPFSLEERRVIFESDPAVTILYADPDRAVYRVDGTLDPDACAPLTAAS